MRAFIKPLLLGVFGVLIFFYLFQIHQDNLKLPSPANEVHPKGFEVFKKPCEERKSAFDSVYATGKWGGKIKSPSFFYSLGSNNPFERQSASGGGSNIGAATAESLKFLEENIPKYGIKTLLDVPCGDVNWQFESYQMDSLGVYFGGDIVPELITLAKLRFSFHSNKDFGYLDVSRCELPLVKLSGELQPRPFDAIHLRDVLQHISLDDGVRSLKNIVSSGIKFLFATHFPGGKNIGITPGEFYSNSFDASPFKELLPKPLKCVETHPNIEKDVTCLYKLVS